MRRSFSASRKGLGHDRNMDCCGSDDVSGLCAVADGIGTRRPSDVASRLVIEEVFKALSKPHPATAGEWRSCLGRALQAACSAVHERSKAPGMAGISSALTLLQVRGEDYAVMHVGDTRCYLLGPGGLRQLTDDHNVAFEAYGAGFIGKEALRSHPDRNMLTRSVGPGDFVVPDIVMGKAPGGRFLLCTDGLTKVLDDARIAAVLAEAGAGQAVCDALVEAAVAGGSEDDVTVLLAEPC